jgi:hypothetical protein
MRQSRAGTRAFADGDHDIFGDPHRELSERQG